MEFIKSSDIKSLKKWLLLLTLVGPVLCHPHPLKIMEISEKNLLDTCRISFDEVDIDYEIDLLRMKTIFSDVHQWLKEALDHVHTDQYESLEVDGFDFVPSISSHSLVNKVDSLGALSDANIVLFKELIKISTKIFDLDDSILDIFYSSPKMKNVNIAMKNSVRRMVCKVTSSLYEDDKIRREIRSIFPMKVKTVTNQSLTHRAIVVSHYVNLLKFWEKASKSVLDTYSIRTDCSNKK